MLPILTCLQKRTRI